VLTASRRALFVLALVPLAMAAPLDAQAAATGATYHTRTLANGLEVVVVPNRSIPFATLQIAFRGGAFTQVTRDLHGLPHVLEHMLFQREERAFSASLSERLNDLDIQTNASTDDETVTYFYVLPAKNVRAGLQLLSDMMRRPNFDQRSLQNEVRAVRGELQRVASEPNALLLTTSERQLWTDAGWERKNAGGNLLSIQDASVQRLQGLHQRFYIPNNAALIVTGDVNPDSVFQIIESTYGNWRRGPDPIAAIPPISIPPLAGITREFVTATVRDVTFLVRWHGPSVDSDRSGAYSAQLFASAVNQPLSGTQRRLVESGLFQSLQMDYLPRRFIGPISIFARTTPERAVAAASALGQELRRLTAPDYVSEEDVSFARKRQRVFDAFVEETSVGVASVIASGWAAADMQYVITENDSVASRSPAELRQFVDTYLKGKNFTVTVLLSTEAQAEVGTRLRTSLNAWRLQ
jgi:zinc protease